jgi:hypothetical protein
MWRKFWLVLWECSDRRGVGQWIGPGEFNDGGPGQLALGLVAGQNAIARITYGRDGQLISSKPISLPNPPNSANKHPPLVAYPRDDLMINQNGQQVVKHYQLFMRSTYGIYDFVGALFRNHADILVLNPDRSGSRGIRAGGSSRCPR